MEENPGLLAAYDEAKTKSYGDWRDDFFKNGYAVIKSVVTPEKAKSYQNKALDWLMSFDSGIDLNDRSTWKKDRFPSSFKSMFFAYCVTHEKFMWDARTSVCPS